MSLFSSGPRQPRLFLRRLEVRPHFHSSFFSKCILSHVLSCAFTFFSRSCTPDPTPRSADHDRLPFPLLLFHRVYVLPAYSAGWICRDVNRAKNSFPDLPLGFSFHKASCVQRTPVRFKPRTHHSQRSSASPPWPGVESSSPLLVLFLRFTPFPYRWPNSPLLAMNSIRFLFLRRSDRFMTFFLPFSVFFPLSTPTKV